MFKFLSFCGKIHLGFVYAPAVMRGLFIALLMLLPPFICSFPTDGHNAATPITITTVQNTNPAAKHRAVSISSFICSPPV